ncbi:hypothetical protein FGB62_26g28 [Gracilaria domingensis]|nr:hypothetical protein FGB62_26g28 [Gracilaria domingensis]
MIGLLINLTLVGVAGTTCRNAGKQGARVNKLEEELKDMEGKMSTLKLQFNDSVQEAEKKLEDRDREWSDKLEALLERKAWTEGILKQEVDKLREEVESTKQFDPISLQKRVAELEHQRKSLRKEIARREEKIIELRNSILPLRK